MSRKRVLWLSHLVPYPPKAGVLLRAYNLVKELARYHDVHLLAFVQENLLTPYFSSLEEGLEKSKVEMQSICSSVEFVPIPMEQQEHGKAKMALKSLFTPHPYNLNWLKSDRYGEAVKRIIANEKIDVVHVDTISLAVYYPRFKHLPYVLDHHNIESHMLFRRSQNEANLLKKIYFYQEAVKLAHYERKYCELAALNITCSELDTQRLAELIKTDNVMTVPNGVDVAFFKPNRRASKQKPRFIFIGTLDWYPNIEAVDFIAENLWPQIKALYPTAEVDIVGSKPPQRLLDLAASEKGFNVHGFVDDILPLFDCANVYLCPITDGGGTKLKVLDACAMAIPIVANTIACEGIRVTHGRDVMLADSVDEYMQAIEQLLGNFEQAEALGQEARKLVSENYTFAAIGKAYAERLNDLGVG